MCLGDIKLALQAGSFEKLVQVAVSPTKVIGASRDRVGLVIGSHATINLFLTFDEAQTDSTGLLIPSGSKPLELSISDNGPLVQKPIFISSASGTPTVVVWETMFAGLWELFNAKEVQRGSLHRARLGQS